MRTRGMYRRPVPMTPLEAGQSVVWIDRKARRPRQGTIRAILVGPDGLQNAAIVAPNDGGLVCVVRAALRAGSLP